MAQDIDFGLHAYDKVAAKTNDSGDQNNTSTDASGFEMS
jgi:hypothetical protein